MAWSKKVYRVVSAESGEMGGRKRWCTGISKKSPASKPRRCSPARGGYREAPGSHLLFDCASTSLQRLQQLCHLRPSNFPTARTTLMSLSNQRRASSARCARVAGVRRAVQILHTSFKTSCKCSVFLSLRKASNFHERAVQLLIEKLDAAALVRALGLKQRVFARPLGLSQQPQGRDRPPTRWSFPKAMPARIGRPPRKSSL